MKPTSSCTRLCKVWNTQKLRPLCHLASPKRCRTCSSALPSQVRLLSVVRANGATSNCLIKTTFGLVYGRRYELCSGPLLRRSVRSTSRHVIFDLSVLFRLCCVRRPAYCADVQYHLGKSGRNSYYVPVSLGWPSRRGAVIFIFLFFGTASTSVQIHSSQQQQPPSGCIQTTLKLRAVFCSYSLKSICFQIDAA